MLELIQNYAEWIVGISAALVLIVAGFRKARRGLASIIEKVSLGLETLSGRDEIRHPETGVVLVEATPPMGARMARIEDAVVSMASSQSAMVALSQRVDHMDNRLSQHIADCPPAATSVVVNAPVSN